MRSIREIGLKIKALGGTILGEWGVFILVILAVTGAFGLGRLSVLMAPNGALLVQNTALAGVSGGGRDNVESAPVKGAYLGAKNGQIYYFPWCAGALKIAPSDRVWFANEVAAQKAGYRPAGNCKGMQAAQSGE